jgi:hypothetical protein
MFFTLQNINYIEEVKVFRQIYIESTHKFFRAVEFLIR